MIRGWQSAKIKLVRGIRKAKKRKGEYIVLLMLFLIISLPRLKAVQAFAREVTLLEKAVVLGALLFLIWWGERATYFYYLAQLDGDTQSTQKRLHPKYWGLLMGLTAVVFSCVSADSWILVLGLVAAFLLIRARYSKWYDGTLEAEFERRSSKGTWTCQKEASESPAGAGGPGKKFCGSA